MHYCISIGTGAGVLTFTTHSRKDVRQEVKNLPEGWTINIWEWGKADKYATEETLLRRCEPEEFMEDECDE